MILLLPSVSVLSRTGKPCVVIDPIKCDYDEHYRMAVYCKKRGGDAKCRSVKMDASLEQILLSAQPKDISELSEGVLSVGTDLIIKIGYKKLISKIE